MSRWPLELAFARAVLALPPAVLRVLLGSPRVSPDGMQLDPQTQILLLLTKATRQPEVQTLGVVGARRLMERIGPALADRAFADVGIRNIRIPGPAGTLAARIYGQADGPSKLPGLVFFHGGGFVVGSLDSHDGACRALAAKAQAMVVSVDYRLAPEHVFPAAVDDALAATRWVLRSAATLGIDRDAVAVGGDSAGGTLAAVVAQSLRHEARRPAFQLLLYPVTDVRGGTQSREDFREGYFLNKRAIDWYMDNYVPDPATHTDPRASPLLASDLSGVPQALVMTAGFDPLRDEGHAYAEKMRAAGVEVEYVCAQGSMHGFFNASGALRASANMVDLAAERLRSALSARRKLAGTSSQWDD